MASVTDSFRAGVTPRALKAISHALVSRHLVRFTEKRIHSLTIVSR